MFWGVGNYKSLFWHGKQIYTQKSVCSLQFYTVMAESDKNIVTLNANGNHHFKHSLRPNLTKIVTLHTNAKEIITLNTVYS